MLLVVLLCLLLEICIWGITAIFLWHSQESQLLLTKQWNRYRKKWNFCVLHCFLKVFQMECVLKGLLENRKKYWCKPCNHSNTYYLWHLFPFLAYWDRYEHGYNTNKIQTAKVKKGCKIESNIVPQWTRSKK